MMKIVYFPPTLIHISVIEIVVVGQIKLFNVTRIEGFLEYQIKVMFLR